MSRPIELVLINYTCTLTFRESQGAGDGTSGIDEISAKNSTEKNGIFTFGGGLFNYC
jgi:hypothetical protein